MLLSVLVCEFPLLQRPPVAPEALTDTTQVFPLGRHTVNISVKSQKFYDYKPWKDTGSSKSKVSSSARHLCFSSKQSTSAAVKCEMWLPLLL